MHLVQVAAMLYWVFLLVKKEIEKVGGWGDKIANANFAEEAEAS